MDTGETKGVFLLSKTGEPKPRRNLLLLIGIDDYQQYEPLRNCVSDLQKLHDALVSRFEFDAGDVRFLKNGEATKTGILNALLKYAGTLTEADNLFVAFSGHGIFNQDEGRCFWITGLPENGVAGQDDYLPDTEILAKLNRLRCHQIVLIVDTCFAGAFLQSEAALGKRRKENLPAPFVLASGRVQPVSDGRSISPFMECLLKALEEHRSSALFLPEVGRKVYAELTSMTGQTPWTGQLQTCGVPQGEFLLRLRPGAETAAPPPNQKSYFKTILAGDLQAKDLMPLRAAHEEGFREYYFKRSYLDEPLSRHYATRQHTLIAGMPLAGKTRAVLHFLKNFGRPELPVLLPEDIPVSKGDFILPEAEQAVVVLDELDRFLAGEHRDWLLQQLLFSGRFFVVATCWTEQVDAVRDSIAHFFHKFEILQVPPLTAGEKQEVLIHAPEKRFFRSDATIGSYFLPLHEMKKRFDSLPSSSLEREIMRSCKVLFIWKKQVAFAAYDKAEVREYVLKRRQHHYGKAGPVFPAQWEEAFAKLHKLALMVEEEDRLLVEEAYLEEFVVDDRNAIAGEYVSYNPGLSIHHKAISICSSLASARRLFERWLGEGFSPDVFTFTSLINKADSWEQAQGVFQQMKASDVPPNIATFISLIDKAGSSEQVQSILHEMKAAGVNIKAAGVNRRRVVTFTSLINKAGSWQEAQGFLEEMKKADVEPNQFTFNSLINKAASWEEAKRVWEEMKKAGFKREQFTFRSFIKKAESWEEVKGVLEEMKKAGVTPNEVTFTSLINKADSWAAAQGILEEMKKAGVTPNEVSFTSLINKAESWAAAKGILEEMKKAGVTPNEFTFTSLINKADSWAAEKGILEEMKKAGVTPNYFTKSSLEKAARKDPALAMHDILVLTPESELFADRMLNYVLLEVCFQDVDEAAFFERYGQVLLQREDDILHYFAAKLQAPEHRIALAEALRIKDWNYWKILGDSQIPEDWQQSEENLKIAMKKAPANYHSLLWVLLAKNIVLNRLEDRYAEAENLCRRALEKQPKDRFNYSLQLLYRLVVLRTDAANLVSALRALAGAYPQVKKELLPFLQGNFCCDESLPPDKVAVLQGLKYYDLFPAKAGKD